MKQKTTYKYQRIRDTREDNDYTQKEIADILNLYLNQYRRYETGETTIPINIVKRLGKLYKVSIDYLTEIEEEIKHNKELSFILFDFIVIGIPIITVILIATKAGKKVYKSKNKNETTMKQNINIKPKTLNEIYPNTNFTTVNNQQYVEQYNYKPAKNEN